MTLYFYHYNPSTNSNNNVFLKMKNKHSILLEKHFSFNSSKWLSYATFFFLVNSTFLLYLLWFYYFSIRLRIPKNVEYVSVSVIFSFFFFYSWKYKINTIFSLKRKTAAFRELSSVLNVQKRKKKLFISFFEKLQYYNLYPSL